MDINRIHQTNDEQLIDNSLWRIASNADLFDHLNIDGSLNPEQRAKVKAFIEYVSSSD